MGPTQGPYILQLCMGPSYFWGSDPPPLFPGLLNETSCHETETKTETTEYETETETETKKILRDQDQKPRDRDQDRDH